MKRLAKLNQTLILGMFIAAVTPVMVLASDSNDSKKETLPKVFTLEEVQQGDNKNGPDSACSCMNPINRFLRSKEKHCAKISPKAARRYKIPPEKAFKQCMAPFLDSVTPRFHECRTQC